MYKIDTIGDSYVVVGGLRHALEQINQSSAANQQKGSDSKQPSHAADIILLALDMQDAVRDLERRNPVFKHIRLRIGVHTGDGVVSINLLFIYLFIYLIILNFSYD